MTDTPAQPVSFEEAVHHMAEAARLAPHQGGIDMTDQTDPRDLANKALTTHTDDPRAAKLLDELADALTAALDENARLRELYGEAVGQRTVAQLRAAEALREAANRLRQLHQDSNGVVAPGIRRDMDAILALIDTPAPDHIVDADNTIAPVIAPAMRCAECDCDNPPHDCNWIKPGPCAPAQPSVQEAAQLLLDMLALSDGVPKIDEKAAQSLWDRVQHAGGFYPVKEFLLEVAGETKG